MERALTTYNTDTDINQLVKTNTGETVVSLEEDQNNPVFENLAAEGG